MFGKAHHEQHLGERAAGQSVAVIPTYTKPAALQTFTMLYAQVLKGYSASSNILMQPLLPLVILQQRRDGHGDQDHDWKLGPGSGPGR